ncbi:hypothetical protein [Muribaculum intestinale]|uniref:hypothetical protein n=1 Tax=Muribaculum intestinale TaxID=1796646 RepID=UPI0025A965CF|nr:hypothetical protein [Muribaculum intestinale]
MDKSKCFSALQAMAYCQGTPVSPGIKRRAWFVPVASILGWPTIPVDEFLRPTSSVYDGAFTLAEGVKWLPLDHLPGKAEFKSEAQGEEPSRTFKVSGTFIHPKIDEDAATAATSLINSRIVVLVEDMRGKYRVIGCEKYDGALVSPSRDNGQGATGTAGTTIAVEADDPVDAPFYTGPIDTEDGIINEAP